MVCATTVFNQLISGLILVYQKAPINLSLTAPLSSCEYMPFCLVIITSRDDKDLRFSPGAWHIFSKHPLISRKISPIPPGSFKYFQSCFGSAIIHFWISQYLHSATTELSQIVFRNSGHHAQATVYEDVMYIVRGTFSQDSCLYQLEAFLTRSVLLKCF